MKLGWKMDNLSQQVVIKYLLEERAKEKGTETYLESVNTKEKVTFGEVSEISNRIGHALQQLGIQKGDTVLTMLPNSFESVYAWYGCCTLGAIEVPVNIAYKGNVLEYTINNSEAKIMIIHESFLPRIFYLQENLQYLKKLIILGDSQPASTYENSRFEITSWSSFLKSGTPEPVPGDVFYYDIAVLLYTSGTTGLSKGVMCTYIQEFETVKAVAPPNTLGPDDCYYCPYPMNHVTAKAMAYAMLIYGGRVAIRDVFSVSHFWTDVKYHRCTSTVLMGATITFLYNSPQHLDEINNPMRFVLAAPAIPEIEEFKERFGLEVCTVFNMTEICSPISSNGFITKDFNYKSCGKPRPGFTCKIVDENDEEVPVGAVGELIVRSDKPWRLNAGYWKNPQKTIEAWKNLWLHTGDAFYRDEAGNFYFVDRIKDCIRRRGENISSSEVEAEVNSHPKVLESAAIGIPSEYGEQEVKSVVVLHQGETMDPLELIEYLRPRMPYYTIPRYIEFVDEIPKTPTEKVKKAILREKGITENTWDREKAGVKIDRHS
jgi:carnitine-CoA ligase